jgi:Glyoxalase-like domain
MPARISCVCIEAVDPRLVADFWAAVLGWEVVEGGDEGISLAWPGTRMLTLDIVPVPEAKQVKNRLHLDLRGGRTRAQCVWVIEPGVRSMRTSSGSRTVAMVIGPFGVA